MSFAVHWIKAEIHEFILKNWRIVKVATTKAQRKLFFNLRSSKKRLAWFTNDEVKSVATDLGVEPNVVREMKAAWRVRTQPLTVMRQMTTIVLIRHRFITLKTRVMIRQSCLRTVTGQQSSVNMLRNALAQLDERSQDILQTALAE